MIKLKSLLQEQTAVYKSGMRDPQVGTKNGPIAKIQQKLIDAGMMDKIPDTDYGIYGPKTAAAVKKFQEKQFPNDSNQWDGKVGDNTMSALNKKASTSNKSNNSTTSNTTPSSTASEIANKLIKATASLDTDESAIQQAVFSIKNQQMYDEVNKLLYNTKKYKDLVHFIDSELGIFDRDRRTKLLNHLKTIVKTPDTRLDRTYLQKTASTFEKPIGTLLFKSLDKIMGKDVIGPKFVQQYLLPKNLTDADFNDFDRKTMGGIIADAIKQGQPVNKGSISYKAYGNKISELLDKKFDPIAFTRSLFTLQSWPVKLLNRLRFAFLFGRFSYKLDPKTKTYTIVEDPYDFSKSGSIKNWPSDDEIKGKTTSEVLQLIKDKNNIGDSWGEMYQILRAYGTIKDPENGSNIVTMTMTGIPLPNESSLLSRNNIV